MYLTGDDGCQGGDDKHGPIHGAGDGCVEGVVDLVRVIPKVGCLAQVRDHHRWVHDAAEAQLHIHNSNLATPPLMA